MLFHPLIAFWWFLIILNWIHKYIKKFWHYQIKEAHLLGWATAPIFYLLQANRLWICSILISWYI
jgi:hypothetical protein